MKALEVTLKYFVIQEGTAVAAKGEDFVGGVSSLELMQILMIFQDISPIQHFEGEPVIHLTTRRGNRYLIRTDLHRLMLYDLRRPGESALVMDASAILLEVDDDLKRSQKGLKERLNRSAAALAAQAKDRSLWWLLGSALVCASLAILLFKVWSGGESVQPRVELITEPHAFSVEAERLAGTYVSGLQAGDVAVTIYPGAELQFLQMGEFPPGSMRCHYTLGKDEQGLWVLPEGMEALRVSSGKLYMGPLVFSKKL